VDLLIDTVAQSQCEGYRWTRHAVTRLTGPRAVFWLASGTGQAPPKARFFSIFVHFWHKWPYLPNASVTFSGSLPLLTKGVVVANSIWNKESIVGILRNLSWKLEKIPIFRLFHAISLKMSKNLGTNIQIFFTLTCICRAKNKIKSSENFAVCRTVARGEGGPVWSKIGKFHK